LKTRLKQWIYTRSVDSSDHKFSEPETEQAISRILKYAEDTEKGTFNPSR
jgi:effector-binding domain-containing protein